MYELELHLLVDGDPGKVALFIAELTENILIQPPVCSVTAWPDPDHPVFDTTVTTQ